MSSFRSAGGRPPHVPGHNGGPTMEPGATWRRHCWRKARAGLLPRTMPLEVVRARVKRAAELGLDVRTYASLRAASGHDVLALLFSSNALHLLTSRGAVRAMAPGRPAKLARLQRCHLGGLAVAPLTVAQMAGAVPSLDDARAAPPPFASWSQMRADLQAALAGVPADRVVLIGETAEERLWAQAARCAGHIPAARYFADLA